MLFCFSNDADMLKEFFWYSESSLNRQHSDMICFLSQCLTQSFGRRKSLPSRILCSWLHVMQRSFDGSNDMLVNTVMLPFWVRDPWKVLSRLWWSLTYLQTNDTRSGRLVCGQRTRRSLIPDIRAVLYWWYNGLWFIDYPMSVLLFVVTITSSAICGTEPITSGVTARGPKFVLFQHH